MASPSPRQESPPRLGLPNERRMVFILLVFVLLVGTAMATGTSQVLDRFEVGSESDVGEHSDYEDLVEFGPRLLQGPPSPPLSDRLRRSLHRSANSRDQVGGAQPCAVMRSCDMRPLAGNMSSKEAKRRFRVDSIKDEILRKLRLDSPPNITVENSTQLQQFFRDHQHLRNPSPPNQTNDDGDYSTISYFVQSQSVPRPVFNTSNSCYFQFQSATYQTNQIVTAQLGVYLRNRSGHQFSPTDGRVMELMVKKNGRRVPSLQQQSGSSHPIERQRRRLINAANPRDFGKWYYFDVKVFVQSWIRNPDQNAGIIFTVNDTRIQSLLVVQPRGTDEETTRPYIQVKVRSSSDVRMRRSLASDCTEDSQERRCCRYPLTIDFDAFRWDWIIAPKRYEAFYCSGDCPFLYYQTNPHTHLIQQVSPRSVAVPCCAPTHVSSLSIIYMDDKSRKIVYGLIPGMVVDKCGCA